MKTPPLELEPARPIIFVSRLKCPHCRGTDHTTVRSIDQGDQSRLLWKTCKACKLKFFVVIE